MQCQVQEIYFLYNLVLVLQYVLLLFLWGSEVWLIQGDSILLVICYCS